MTELQADLQAKEAIIRQKVRAQAEVKQAAARPTRTEAIRLPLPHPEVIATRPALAKTKEAAPSVVVKNKPERIGKVIVQAEAVQTKRAEVAGNLKEKEVVSLSRTELMVLSEKIVVDNTTLRQIYESNLVGERGLRRLVQEYLRGEDMQKALKRELVERQIDFERDPILRDRSHGDTIRGGGVTNATSSLAALLANAGALPEETAQSDAFLKAKAAHDEQVVQQQKHQRRIVDVSLISTITVLLAVIMLLVFR